jgi:hypothetical protein
MPRLSPTAVVEPALRHFLNDLLAAIDFELKNRPKETEVQKVLIQSPNGSVWAIGVSDSGVVSATAVFTQP